MSMEEIWGIKEEVSKELWGRSVEEINTHIKPSSDALLEEIKRKKQSIKIA